MSTLVELGPAPAQAQGSVWDYVSPSRLNLWLQCPLAFKLRYIDGVRLPATASQLIGKQVHAGLEQWYRHRQLGLPLTPADMLSRNDATWEAAAQAERIVFETVAVEAEARQQVRALLTAYLSSAPRDDPLPVAVETRLTASLIDPASGEDLGLPLLGIVDLVLAEQAGPLVVDFKTSARSGGAQEIQHEVQLTSYAYLIRETAGQIEAGLEIRSLVKTKTPKIERQRYERRQERHFRRLFAVLREYLDALDRGRYSYRPGWSCQACALRDSHCLVWDG
jgi:CRISPR/Cas system-associated exonuclease Cas4 (RecB family)